MADGGRDYNFKEFLFVFTFTLFGVGSGHMDTTAHVWKSRTPDGTWFSRPCRFQVLNSDLQAWQQALLSVGSSCRPTRGYSFKEGKEGRCG